MRIGFSPGPRCRAMGCKVARMSGPSKTLFVGFLVLSLLLILHLLRPDPAMSQTRALHPHAAELKNEDGSWKYTNALVRETSPYLLQHAHNPVDWYAWGPKAFDAARKSGKPIFLSIGYSTCYWCHVMERQCFENPAIARQMNDQFVCIKVDREERPDVDDIYMAATVMLNRGQGGWPMSVFLTPPGASGPDDKGLKPFFAGTYFPPESHHGRPGFPHLMEQLTQAWQQRRADVVAAADEITNHVAGYIGQRDASGTLEPDAYRTAADQLVASYDTAHGGFGRPPKFPTPNNLQFLMGLYRVSGQAELGKALRHTLDRMARGGMYDQVGGGFHRYSVDEKWLVPHFEKMLYDNGQLLQVYVEADALLPDTDDPLRWLRVAREVCEYVLREMLDETGTFWSAQDAEVDAREGGSYLWTPEEVRRAIGDADLAVHALRLYGLDRGTNFTDPHAADAPPSNVLYLPERLEQCAGSWQWTLAETVDARERINTAMYAARRQRKQPGTDDKVLTAWNGIMIAGMADAGRVLGEPRYMAAAAKAAEFFLSRMRTDDGGLYRSMRAGQVKIEGFLEDYVFLVHGLLRLHRADDRQAWIDAAIELTEVARRRFAAANGGYFDTLADQPDLIVRTRTTSDTAIPSGNSQMVHNLLTLFEVTEEERFLQWANDDLQSFAGSLAAHGVGMAHMQHALMRYLAVAPAAVKAAEQIRPEVLGKSKPLLRVQSMPSELDLSGVGGTVRVTITVDAPYHVNAHNPGLEGLVGMRFELRPVGSASLQVNYPRGTPRTFAYSDAPIHVYEGKVVCDVTVSPGDAGEEYAAKPRLVLKYQICGDDACLAPAEIQVPLRFTGVADSEGAP